jgi:hypothetical protein
MRLADQIIGALNLCPPGPRECSDEDIAVAAVPADLVNSYVVYQRMRRHGRTNNAASRTL